jgi:hypothetical protein
MERSWPGIELHFRIFKTRIARHPGTNNWATILPRGKFSGSDLQIRCRCVTLRRIHRDHQPDAFRRMPKFRHEELRRIEEIN